MSIQDVIASQNLSASGPDTVMKLLELQSRNQIASQQAAVASNGQAIQQQQNVAQNALDLQRNKTNELSVQQQGQYQQGELADKAQGRDIQKNTLDLQAKSQEDESKRGWAHVDIAKDGVEIQKGDLQLKQAKQMLEQQQRDTVAKGWQTGGADGAIQALASMGDIKSASEIMKTQAYIQHNFYQDKKTIGEITDQNAKRDGLQRMEALSRDILPLATIKDPAQKQQETIKIAKDHGFPGSDYIGSQLYLNAATHSFQKDIQSVDPETKAAVFGDNPYISNKDSPDIVKLQQARDQALLQGKQSDAAQLDTAIGRKGQGPTINNNMVKSVEQAVAEKQFETTGNAVTSTRTVATMANSVAALATQSPIKGGTFGDFGQKGLELANALDLAPDSAVTPGKMIEAFHTKMAVNLRPQGAGSMSDVEQKIYMDSTPGNNWTREAKQRFANFATLEADRTAALQDFQLEWLNKYKSTAGMNSAWNQFIADNPVINDKGAINKSNIRNYGAYLEKGFSKEQDNNYSLDEIDAAIARKLNEGNQ